VCVPAKWLVRESSRWGPSRARAISRRHRHRYMKRYRIPLPGPPPRLRLRGALVLLLRALRVLERPSEIRYGAPGCVRAVARALSRALEPSTRRARGVGWRCVPACACTLQGLAPWRWRAKNTAPVSCNPVLHSSRRAGRSPHSRYRTAAPDPPSGTDPRQAGGASAQRAGARARPGSSLLRYSVLHLPVLLPGGPAPGAEKNQKW